MDKHRFIRIVLGQLHLKGAERAAMAERLMKHPEVLREYSNWMSRRALNARLTASEDCARVSSQKEVLNAWEQPRVK